MFIYITTAFLSTVMLFAADHDSNYRNGRSSRIREIIYILVILAMATIAGGRALSVGTDTGYYGIGIFKIVNNYNWNDFISNLFTTSIRTQTFEPGYVTLNFVISRITNNTFFLFFCISFFTIYITFKAFDKNNINCPTWVAMSFYFFMYYNESLNLMRQSLAAAIMLYAVTYLREKKYINCLIVMLVGCLFHYGAAVGLVFLAIKILLEGKMETIKKVLIISFMVLFLYALPQIVLYAYNIGILSERYTWYFESGRTLSLNINQIIIRLPMLVMFLLNYKDIVIRDKNSQMFFVMLISDLIFSQAGAYGNASYRIGSYFGYTKAFAYPLIATCKMGKYRKIKNLLSFVIVFSIWIYTILIQNYNSTIPYVWGPVEI